MVHPFNKSQVTRVHHRRAEELASSGCGLLLSATTRYNTVWYHSKIRSSYAVTISMVRWTKKEKKRREQRPYGTSHVLGNSRKFVEILESSLVAIPSWNDSQISSSRVFLAVGLFVSNEGKDRAGCCHRTNTFLHAFVRVASSTSRRFSWF